MKSQTNFLDEFPQRVKWMRGKAGWSQKQLADAVDVSRPFIALIESGRRLPSMKVLKKIMDTLSEKVGPRASNQGWWKPLPTNNHPVKE